MDSALLSRVLDLAVAIQQIPAPTFDERARAAFIHESFLAEGLCEVAGDELGNVYGCLKGSGRTRPLVVSAHMDTVFPSSTDLRVRRTPGKIHGPGIGDNSLGVAGLFGLLWSMQQKSGESLIPGDIWLVANVGEEGLGDLRGMRAVVERFGSNVLAYLILEGMALGQIYHRGLGVQRYRITVRTHGGHSWVDYGIPSAVNELAMLVTRLAALPLPQRPRTSLNVGVIAGGTTVNTIAAEAHMELDLRSEGTRALEELIQRVESVLQTARRSDVKITCEEIGRRPPGRISASHPLVKLAKRSIEVQGIAANLGIGSTDANIPLSQELPAVCIGLTTGGSAHTVNEFIYTSPLHQGLEQLTGLVEAAFKELN